MAYNLLKGKRGIITGALDEHSIAWKVAQKCHEEGATFPASSSLPHRAGQILLGARLSQKPPRAV